MGTLTTGEVAEQAGVNIETVRYYERRGLIPEPPRRPSGHRKYNPDFVKRIRFIKRAQDLGFTLNEIDELLSIRVDPDTDCGAMMQRTEDKISEVEQKIYDLKRIRDVLIDLVDRCQGEGSTAECPILEAMETDEAE